jgi:hypothetical protein
MSNGSPPRFIKDWLCLTLDVGLLRNIGGVYGRRQRRSKVEVVASELESLVGLAVGD